MNPFAHDRECGNPCARFVTFWFRPTHLEGGKHHQPVRPDDVYREFTFVSHAIHHSPSTPDAGVYAFPSRLGRPSCDSGIHCRRVAFNCGGGNDRSPAHGTADGTTGPVSAIRSRQDNHSSDFMSHSTEDTETHRGDIRKGEPGARRPESP